MTARTRSRLRYAALTSVAALVAMALGFLALRGAYERAYADGAAAVAAAPPSVHDPLTDPGAYGGDVMTAFQAGEWGGLSVALLIGAIAVVNVIADRRKLAWLARAAPVVAGAAAVLATMAVFLASQRYLDVHVLVVVISAVGLALARMPGHTTSTSPPPSRLPLPPEAGCARLHLVVGLGLAALLTVPFWIACDPARRGVAEVRQDVIDCGRAEVLGLATDLAPAVATILTGDTPSWRAQLDALLSAGAHAGACAIKAVGGELAARAAAVVTGAHAEGQERVGADHAREYLADHHYVFEAQR